MSETILFFHGLRVIFAATIIVGATYGLLHILFAFSERIKRRLKYEMEEKSDG